MYAIDIKYTRELLTGDTVGLGSVTPMIIPPQGLSGPQASLGPGSLHPTRLGGNQPALRGGLCHEAKLMPFLSDGAAAHHVAHRRLDHHRGGLALLHVGVEHLHPGHLLPPRPIPLELEAPVGRTAEMRSFKLR